MFNAKLIHTARNSPNYSPLLGMREARGQLWQNSLPANTIIEGADTSLNLNEFHFSAP